MSRRRKPRRGMPQRPVPPRDDEPSESPYVPGFSVQIQRHQPPPTKRHNLREEIKGIQRPDPAPRPRIDESWLEKATHLEAVLAYPPLETPTPANLDPHRLEIQHAFAIGSERGPQVVACSVTSLQPDGRSFLATAKIYDALHYESKIDAYRLDTVAASERDYANEAAAYEHIEANGRTDFTPEYYGSWTFSLGPEQRPVRLVLIELLRGCTVMNLDEDRRREHLNPYMDPEALQIPHLPDEWCPRDLPEDWRLDVLAQILDGKVRQRQTGLDQRDAESRNVMLVPSSPGPITEQVPRVVLFDYNIARIWEEHPMMDSALPVNPMQYWWDWYFADLPELVPAEWFTNQRKLQEWLLSRFGGDKLQLYAPLKRKLRLDKDKEKKKEKEKKREKKMKSRK